MRRWLVEEAALASDRLVAIGLGESQPVAPNEKPDGSDDPAGRQKNRRVELIVEKPVSAQPSG